MSLSCKLLTQQLNLVNVPQGSCLYEAFYGLPTADEDRFKLLDRVYELGCVHWDSAALYGDSEEPIGRWFQGTGKRREVRPELGPRKACVVYYSTDLLSNKVRKPYTPDGGRQIGNDREYIQSAVAESLRRLQTDYIDLLYWFVATHAQ